MVVGVDVSVVVVVEGFGGEDWVGGFARFVVVEGEELSTVGFVLGRERELRLPGGRPRGAMTQYVGSKLLIRSSSYCTLHLL